MYYHIQPAINFCLQVLNKYMNEMKLVHLIVSLRLKINNSSLIVETPIAMKIIDTAAFGNKIPVLSKVK